MGAEISFVCVFWAPSCRLLICWEPAAEGNDEGRKRNHRFCLLRSNELQNLMDSLVPDLVFTCLGYFPEFAQELKYILPSLARWLFSETLQGFFWQLRDEMSSPPDLKNSSRSRRGSSFQVRSWHRRQAPAASGTLTQGLIKDVSEPCRDCASWNKHFYSLNTWNISAETRLKVAAAALELLLWRNSSRWEEKRKEDRNPSNKKNDV